MKYKLILKNSKIYTIIVKKTEHSSYKLYLKDKISSKMGVFFAICNEYSSIEKTILQHFGFGGELKRID